MSRRWDFAAVVYGEHDRAWWHAFATALTRSTQAQVISIEHEDRMHDVESGVLAASDCKTVVTVAGCPRWPTCP